MIESLSTLLPNLEFAWPWVFAALPLPLLAVLLMPRAQPRGTAALRLPFYDEVVDGGTHRSAGPGRLRKSMAWMIWLLLVLAAARPQWLGEPVQIPMAGRDLMLAVDISGSMEQQDYRLGGRIANRLDVVKVVAGRFIEERVGDRLGLVLFGTRAYVQTPLTYDRATVRAMLDEAVIGLAGRETAIGDAIGLSIKRLREQPRDNRVLILLTDGASTAGNIAPLDAAKLAAQEGIRVYTIAIGSGSLGMGSPFGVLMKRGQDLDPETLREIAKLTGGRFFEASDAEQLRRIYEELNELEPSVRDSRSFRPMQPLYHWPAGAALLLSLLLALSMLVWRARARSLEVADDAG